MPGKGSTPPYQSRLIPYQKEIMRAWFKRKTLKQIQQLLLKKHGITIAFIKRRRNRSDPHTAPAAPPAKTKRRKISAKDLQALKVFSEKSPREVHKEYNPKQS